MKLISYRTAGPAVHIGAVVDEMVHELDAVVRDLSLDTRAGEVLAEAGGRGDTVSMQKLLLAGESGIQQVRQALSQGRLPSTPLAGVQLLAPVPRPGKVLGVGRNYGAHAKESGSGPFEQPRIFTKVSSSVQPPGSRIRIPDPILKPDFEVELAVVIGSFARNVTEQDALGHVAGYTVLHDMSAREFQFDVSPPQTSFAKSFDGAMPTGPWIVTADEIPDPQQLALRCEINGEVLQEDTTAGMIFSVAFLVSYLSRFMTLEPGDVIATGTPSGVGAFRKPPRWLKSGDHIRLTVERIGTLEHWIA
jgi:2-keto-4-pentenoate hydratase/2-oxohepta-3-ene-1,7-dioic acid hydratase in catechol pathway